MSNVFDSEISSGEMAESTKGEDESAKGKEHKHRKVPKSPKKKEKDKKEKARDKSRDENNGEGKKEIGKESAKKSKIGREKNLKKSIGDKRSSNKQQVSSKEKRKDVKTHSRSPKRSRGHRRDFNSPKRASGDRGRGRTSPDSHRRYRSRSRDYGRYRGRSRSPGRRVSDTHERNSSSRHGRRERRGSRDWRRRCHSRSRSRSVSRYRSDSTTSFSISSFGSDMDTLPAEKNVVPATSTTNPPGFGQGLYIPQLNRGGMGDLLTSIKLAQTDQRKDSVIAKYTAICQKISSREGEPRVKKEGHVSTSGEMAECSQSESKFKRVEEEFPCSHGSEHRKATFDSDIGYSLDEVRPFTDPNSINKMLLGIKPGQFTGDKAALLPMSLLEGGDPAWAKKNQFKRLAPIGDGFGRKMMEKMGWREGMALGKSGHGVMTPLELDVKTDRKGLGVGSNRDPLFLPPPPAPYPPFQMGHPVNPAAVPTPAPSRLVEPNALAGGKHPVCVLMEICAKKRWDHPEFEEVGEQRAKSFKFKVSIPVGSYQPLHPSVNKKEAKKQAALACLQALGQVPSKTIDFVSSSLAPPTPSYPPLNPTAPFGQAPMVISRQVFTPANMLRNPPSFQPPQFPVNQMPFVQQPYS